MEEVICGGFSEQTPADSKVQELVTQVQPDVEAKLGKTFTQFEATTYQTQVVAGINYEVNVTTNCGTLLVTIFEALECDGGEIQLSDVQCTGKKECAKESGNTENKYIHRSIITPWGIRHVAHPVNSPVRRVIRHHPYHPWSPYHSYVSLSHSQVAQPKCPKNEECEKQTEECEENQKKCPFKRSVVHHPSALWSPVRYHGYAQPLRTYGGFYGHPYGYARFGGFGGFGYGYGRFWQFWQYGQG